MQSSLNSSSPEASNMEQVMSVNDFTRLDIPTRTSVGGAWYEHKTYKKRFFVKPVSNWTFDNRDNEPLSFKASPIMALFLGNIFKILMKGRAPDHYFVSGTFMRDYVMKVSIASMFLDNFVTFKEIGINREYARIENVKGLHRYLAATIILSNYDIGVGNFGLIQENGGERIAGIDLDASLSDCFNSFRGYFNRLECNAKFSQEICVLDEDIDLDEVHNRLKNKVNFQKLLDRLDKACDLIEKNLSDVKLHLEKQESEFLNLLKPFF